MNLIQTKKYAFLMALCAFVPSSEFFAQSPAPAPKKVVVESLISTADHLVSDAQKQLDQIAIIFVTLSGIISTKQVVLPNKPKVLTQLRSISSFIQTLRSKTFVEADIDLAYEFLHLNNIIMTYAIEGLSTNFAHVEKTSLEHRIKSKPMPEHVDITQTAQLLMKNQFILAQLTYKIDNYGLRWYNHAYRLLDDYVIAPCNRHSIPRRALFIVGSVFFTSYMWRQIDYDSYKGYCPNFLQLGSNPPRARNGVNDDDESMSTPKSGKKNGTIDPAQLRRLIGARKSLRRKSL